MHNSSVVQVDVPEVRTDGVIYNWHAVESANGTKQAEANKHIKSCVLFRSREEGQQSCTTAIPPASPPPL